MLERAHSEPETRTKPAGTDRGNLYATIISLALLTATGIGACVHEQQKHNPAKNSNKTSQPVPVEHKHKSP